MLDAIQVCNVPDPSSFSHHIWISHKKSFGSSSCSDKSGKTGKNAMSVTGGQRAVTLCADVVPEK